MDRHGRLIYLDHINKRTTWHPPIILDTSTQDDKRQLFGLTNFFELNFSGYFSNLGRNIGINLNVVDNGITFLLSCLVRWLDIFLRAGQL